MDICGTWTPTTGTVIGTTANYSSSCFNRLPCGLCKLTMSYCPLCWQGVPITCGTTMGSNTTCTATSTSAKMEVEE